MVQFSFWSLYLIIDEEIFNVVGCLMSNNVQPSDYGVPSAETTVRAQPCATARCYAIESGLIRKQQTANHVTLCESCDIKINYR